VAVGDADALETQGLEIQELGLGADCASVRRQSGTHRVPDSF
jgi:hypothetical protein